MFKYFNTLRKPRVSISQSLWPVNHPKHYAQLVRPAMAPAGKRIVFTGGSGKAGRHVIPELLKRGHHVRIGGFLAQTHGTNARVRC